MEKEGVKLKTRTMFYLVLALVFVFGGSTFGMEDLEQPAEEAAETLPAYMAEEADGLIEPQGTESGSLTYYGVNAGLNDSGFYNSFFGGYAGKNNTQTGCTFAGYSAGRDNQGGNACFFGYYFQKAAISI